MRLVFLAAFFMCAILPGASAPENGSKDTVTVDSTQQTDSVKKRKGLINRFLDYINESNKTDPGKKFDFSLLGGPHYSTDTKFGLGLVATGIYRTDMADTLLPPSNTALYGDITTGQFYKIGIRGTHIFPHDKCRLDYNVSFDSFKSSFWGIGYVNGNKDSNGSTMDRIQVQAKASLQWRFADNLYIGPTVVFDYAGVSHVERPELLEGMEGERVDEGGIVRHDIEQDVRHTSVLERQGQSIAVARLVDASHRTEAVQRVCGEDACASAPDAYVDLSDGLGDGLPVHARAVVPDKGVPHGLPFPPFPQVDVRKADLNGAARLIGARDGKHKGE